MPSAHSLTDHDAIRRWAEARGAKPACVKGTGRKGDTGMIRLDFPGFSGGESLQPIGWDQWFRSFDDNRLALLVQDKTARGGRSNFNKLVARRTAEGEQHSRGEGRRASSTRRRSRSRGRARSSSSTASHSSSGRGSTSSTRSSGSERHVAADRPARRTAAKKRPSTRSRKSSSGPRRSRKR